MKAPSLELEALEQEQDVLKSKFEAYHCANEALPRRVKGLALTNKPVLDCYCGHEHPFHPDRIIYLRPGRPLPTTNRVRHHALMHQPIRDYICISNWPNVVGRRSRVIFRGIITSHDVIITARDVLTTPRQHGSWLGHSSTAQALFGTYLEEGEVMSRDINSPLIQGLVPGRYSIFTSSRSLVGYRWVGT